MGKFESVQNCSIGPHTPLWWFLSCFWTSYPIFFVLLIEHIVLVIILICAASWWIKNIVLDNDCNTFHTFLPDNDKEMFSMYSIYCIVAYQMYNNNTVCFHTQWSCGGKLVRITWNVALKEFQLRKSHTVFFSFLSGGVSEVFPG